MTRPPAPPLPAGLRRLPIAHRGLHDRRKGRPENSRAAVAAAVAHGYGIELDLQLSADGRAVVFHDETLERLTPERGPLCGRTAAELARIPLKDAEGERIPTLAEILALVGGRAPLLIEVKDRDGALGPEVGALEAAAADDLAGYGGPVAVMSFNPHAVAALARAAPQLPRGLVTSAFHARAWPDLPRERRDRLRAIPDYEAVGASFVSHEAADLARPRIAELKAQGAAILCWTIRTPEAESLARRIADNVTFEGYLATIPPA